MSIDGCNRSFEELIHEVLPGYMRTLRERMSDPLPLRDLSVKGIGPVTILRRLGYEYDPCGCYVFIEGGKPVYVGISKHIIARLFEHARGSDHFTATLAYRIAKHESPHRMTASDAIRDTNFRDYFLRTRKRMLDWHAAFVKIDNPLELYLFEPYSALELDTGFDAGGWNTFETH